MRPGPCLAVLAALGSIGASARAAVPRAPPPFEQPPERPPLPYPSPASPYPPERYQSAPVLSYQEGQPVPEGYQLEERPRTALVTTGWILTGVAYGGALAASGGAGFKNESGWLAVPLLGPWMTLGQRNYHCDNSSDARADCVADVFVVMGLIMDGIMQSGGGTLLMVGYLAPKKGLVREDATLRIVPMRVGSGQGVGIRGSF